MKSIPAILINNQVITGDTVFEYFGKLVEGKKSQEQRIKENNINSNDEGQCRINKDGELEGWCLNDNSNLGGVNYSTISEENDDYTKKNYKIETSYEYIKGEGTEVSINNKIKNMEQNDKILSHKVDQFNDDYEKLQQDRSNLMNIKQSQNQPQFSLNNKIN